MSLKEKIPFVFDLMRFGFNTATDKSVMQEMTAGGAAYVANQNSDSWAWPNSQVIQWTGVAEDVSSGTSVYESGDISQFNRIEFEVTVAPGASGISVYPSFNGVNFSPTPIQVFDRSLVEGATTQSVTLISAIGNYYFDCKWPYFKIVNNGNTTGAAAEVRGISGVK